MFTLSACSGWFEGDPVQKYREAKKYGFRAMEDLNWTGWDLPRIREVIDETGVEQSALLMASRDDALTAMIRNEHGLVWEDAYSPFMRAIEETRDACLALGVKNIIVTSGNERQDVSRYVQHTNLVTALANGACLLEGTGIQLVMEPLNVLVDHKGYYLTTSAECADLIREVGNPRVRMLFDIYHQQITEGNVTANLRQYHDLIGHIHVADVPGRKQPGTGELNYRNIFKAIAETGYDGFVTFECGRTVSAEQVCRDMLALL